MPDPVVVGIGHSEIHLRVDQPDSFPFLCKWCSTSFGVCEDFRVGRFHILRASRKDSGRSSEIHCTLFTAV